VFAAPFINVICRENMPQHLKSLRTRHHEILRLHFLGRNNVEIAAALNMTPAGVGCVIRSPLAQAELARLASKADDSITNVPVRALLTAELNGAAIESLRHNRRIMNDASVSAGVRTRVASHFLDRVVFMRNAEEETPDTYREILRSLKTLEDKFGDDSVKVIRTLDIEKEAS
jgi:hypothetical protein